MCMAVSLSRPGRVSGKGPVDITGAQKAWVIEVDWLFALRCLRHRAVLTRNHTPAVTHMSGPFKGNYGNVLPGAVLIKNNLILIAASERTLLPILSSPFLLDI